MEMYRAVPREAFDAATIHGWRPGSRLPSNVPYFVDNLWELARPPHLPSRRKAVYASPTPSLALASATAGNLPQADYVACRVKLNGTPKLFQLSKPDARDHRDLKVLQKLVHAAWKDWGARTMSARLALAPLFFPGGTRAELEDAMAADPAVRTLIEAAVAAVTVWTDLPNAAEGEIIFELGQGDSYTLEPV